MKLNNIFKIRLIKQLRYSLKENVLMLFSFFKKEKLSSFKNKKIFLIFVILCLCLILVFFAYRFDNTNKKDGEVNDEIVEVEEEVLSDEEIREMEIEELSEEETIYGVLGNFWVEIDTEDLKIKAPVVEGTTKEDLDKGVGHQMGTTFPNRESGNVVLSGHRWFPGDVPARTVFIDLDKLKVNDKVKVYYENKEFVYNITDSQIIEVEKDGTQKNGINILQKTENPTITIYTCEPKYPLTTPTKRLVYFGELVE